MLCFCFAFGVPSPSSGLFVRAFRLCTFLIIFFSHYFSFCRSCSYINQALYNLLTRVSFFILFGFSWYYPGAFHYECYKIVPNSTHNTKWSEIATLRYWVTWYIHSYCCSELYAPTRYYTFLPFYYPDGTHVRKIPASLLLYRTGSN